MSQSSSQFLTQPSEQEARVARHFAVFTSCVTDLQDDIQALMNLCGKQREELALLKKEQRKESS